MKRATLLLILCGVLLNAAGQLMLKAGALALDVSGLFGHHNLLDLVWHAGMQPWILGGLSCYLLSTILWIPALSRVDVMVAYPMVSLGYVVNAFVAWQFLGEALTPQRLAGIAVIMVGVVILSRG